MSRATTPAPQTSSSSPPSCCGTGCSPGSSTPRARSCAAGRPPAASPRATRCSSRTRAWTGSRPATRSRPATCWSGSATRDGTDPVSAVLGAPSEAARDAETEELLDYGFSLYRASTPVKRGEELADPDLDYRDETLPLVAARAIEVSVREGQAVATEVTAPDEVSGDDRGGREARQRRPSAWTASEPRSHRSSRPGRSRRRRSSTRWHRPPRTRWSWCRSVGS